MLRSALGEKPRRFYVWKEGRYWIVRMNQPNDWTLRIVARRRSKSLALKFVTQRELAAKSWLIHVPVLRQERSESA